MAIKEAALSPGIHRDLWDEHKGNLPSDETLRYELRVNRNFTDSAIASFIKELRSTWVFAKLTEYAIMCEDGQDKVPSESEVGMMSSAIASPTEKETKSKAQGLTASAVKYSWPLSKNVLAEITITGNEITSNDLEMLRRYLELAKSAIENDQPTQGS